MGITSNQLTNNYQITNGFDFLESIEILDRKFFDWPWTSKQWKELLDYKEDYLLLVCLDQDALPIAMVLFKKDPDCYHLLKLLVAPYERKKGIAQALLDASLKKVSANSIYLEVAQSNEAAQKFYLKNNFKVLVVKKNFYRDGSNALALELKTK